MNTKITYADGLEEVVKGDRGSTLGGNYWVINGDSKKHYINLNTVKHLEVSYDDIPQFTDVWSIPEWIGEILRYMNDRSLNFESKLEVSTEELNKWKSAEIYPSLAKFMTFIDSMGLKLKVVEK